MNQQMQPFITLQRGLIKSSRGLLELNLPVVKGTIGIFKYCVVTEVFAFLAYQSIISPYHFLFFYMFIFTLLFWSKLFIK